MTLAQLYLLVDVAAPGQAVAAAADPDDAFAGATPGTLADLKALAQMRFG